MTLTAEQLKRIDEAKQALEVNEAIETLSDEDVALTAKEEQHIIDSTSSEEEAQTYQRG